MPAKTISVDAKAYSVLSRARRSPEETFSQVILRAQWPAQGKTCGQLLKALPKMPAASTTVIRRLDKAQAADAPPDSSWS